MEAVNLLRRSLSQSLKLRELTYAGIQNLALKQSSTSNIGAAALPVLTRHWGKYLTRHESAGTLDLTLTAAVRHGTILEPLGSLIASLHATGWIAVGC